MNEQELVTTFTQEELKAIAKIILKDWRVYFVAGVVLAVGVFLLYWQVHSQIRSQLLQFQNAASNQLATAYSDSTNQLATKFRNFTRQASNDIASAYSSVTNQIAEEFQTPRVRETVESVAKNEAKIILKANVQPEIDRFRADADFLRLAMRARAYDFKAYRELLAMETQTDDNAQYAQQVVAEVDKTLERDRLYAQTQMHRFYEQYSGTNVDSGPFTSDEIALRFGIAMHDRVPNNREGFINTASDLNNPGFMPFFIEFLTNEADLAVADRVTLAISKLSDQDFHPHDYERILQWWDIHHEDFTNWPVTTLLRGLNQFDATHYREAGECFSAIVEQDPTADMSRALAIGCDWELGNTNKAAELTKHFKDPNGRWFQLADAKAELESGNVGDATAKVASLVKKFPLMSGLPPDAFHFWRRIDWNAFNRLISANKHLAKP